MRCIRFAAPFALSALAPAAALADMPPGLNAEAELHGALFGGTIQNPLVQTVFGWGVRGGYRPRAWGAFLLVEQDLWRTVEASAKTQAGTLNVGLGGEYVFAGNLVRTSLAAGPSVLLFDTPLDNAGSTGVFVDLRPLGLRWPLGEHGTLGVDPLTLTVAAPVLSGIPLVRVEFRTYVAGGMRF